MALFPAIRLYKALFQSV